MILMVPTLNNLQEIINNKISKTPTWLVSSAKPT